jgi:hypothetical protein
VLSGFSDRGGQNFDLRFFSLQPSLDGLLRFSLHLYLRSQTVIRLIRCQQLVDAHSHTTMRWSWRSSGPPNYHVPLNLSFGSSFVFMVMTQKPPRVAKNRAPDNTPVSRKRPSTSFCCRQSSGRNEGREGRSYAFQCETLIARISYGPKIETVMVTAGYRDPPKHRGSSSVIFRGEIRTGSLGVGPGTYEVRLVARTIGCLRVKARASRVEGLIVRRAKEKRPCGYRRRSSAHARRRGAEFVRAHLAVK